MFDLLTLQQIIQASASEPFDDSLVFEHISTDSRECRSGNIFFAIAGSKFDGSKFVLDARSRGAVAVVVEEEVLSPAIKKSLGIAVLEVSDIRRALALAASWRYGSNVKDDVFIGITGTNGKTSVAWILAQALRVLGASVSYSGTLGFFCFYPDDFCGEKYQQDETANIKRLGLTTQEPCRLHRDFAAAHSTGVSHHVLEVSSHALDQKRTAGITWRLCLATNLSRDHLDYHATMRDYARAKIRLFEAELADSSQAQKTAVLNLDDPLGSELFKFSKFANAFDVVSFSRTVDDAGVLLTKAECTNKSTRVWARVCGKKISFSSQILGDYNVSNLLAALAALCGLGYSPKDAARALSKCPAVPGRLEVIERQPFLVVVDYAHSPDALSRVLESLRPLTPGKLICVFGCGGDRDRGKRPQMGEEVAGSSDFAIVTSDNPRTEDPLEIIARIVCGMETQKQNRKFSFVVEPDRAKAIYHAISMAKPGDTVLVAGKGHETYQDIAGVKTPYSDQAACRHALAQRYGWGKK